MDIDTSAQFGGQDSAPTPKELVLNAMMGCTAMDVVSILKKMRVPLEKFSMTIQAEKNQGPPVHFIKATLTFELIGEVPPEKAFKAVESSLTKHCGVNYMISKVCDILYVLKINGQVTHEGHASFIDPQN